MDAFNERANAIARSGAFSIMARKYDSDPGYRNRMDREVASGDSSNAVLLDYKRSEYEPAPERAKEAAATS